MTGRGRRALMVGLLGLGGCGFRPVYLPRGPSEPGFADVLSQIYVPVLPERSGQLLRQALQARLDGAGEGGARKYELAPSLRLGSDAIGIQRDNSTSRMRIDASVTWVLRSLTADKPVVTQGTARLLDGYNIIDQQFFAAELNNDSVQRRIMVGLADQIVLQLAAYFQRAAM